VGSSADAYAGGGGGSSSGRSEKKKRESPAADRRHIPPPVSRPPSISVAGDPQPRGALTRGELYCSELGMKREGS
jgi:hypothetical protein